MSEKKRKEPWRVAVFAASVGYIVYRLVDRDVLSVYRNMPTEEALPLIVTTCAVTLLKVALLAGAVLLGRRLFSRFGRK